MGAPSYLIDSAWYLPQMLHILYCRFGSNSPGYAYIIHHMVLLGPIGPLLFNLLARPLPLFCKGLQDLCQMHRIHTLTPLFQHNDGVETPLQYLLQTACTTTPFSMPTVWGPGRLPGLPKAKGFHETAEPESCQIPCCINPMHCWHSRKILHVPKLKLPEISQCGEFWSLGKP